MIVAGLLCMGTGVVYYFLTQDAPEGNYKELRQQGKIPEAKHTKGSFLMAGKDPRVWALFIIYAACFGVELTINNVAALYFTDHFGMGLAAAGTAAALFGLMNLFARTCGGIMGDKFAAKWGLKGRVSWLFLALFGEGIALMCFSQMPILLLAIPMLIVFSLFCQMAEGATYSVVPFVNKQALGSVAGIVGAGGNAGAVAAGFLFKGALAWPTALLILGALVLCVSFLAFAVRFSPTTEREVHADLQSQLGGAGLEPAT
jgi:NNP family nitrate/nitrite transporter-like MFS transporter